MTVPSCVCMCVVFVLSACHKTLVASVVVNVPQIELRGAISTLDNAHAHAHTECELREKAGVC